MRCHWRRAGRVGREGVTIEGEGRSERQLSHGREIEKDNQRRGKLDCATSTPGWCVASGDRVWMCQLVFFTEEVGCVVDGHQFLVAGAYSNHIGGGGSLGKVSETFLLRVRSLVPLRRVNWRRVGPTNQLPPLREGTA